MPGSITKLPDSDLLDEIRARTSDGLSDANWTNTDVYSVQAPIEESLPLATASIDDSGQSSLAKDKDTSPVAVYPTVRLWSRDHQAVEDGANQVVQRVTSDRNRLSLSGWVIHVLRLSFVSPNHDLRTDGPSLYGKTIQFEIHLEPTP